MNVEPPPSAGSRTGGPAAGRPVARGTGRARAAAGRRDATVAAPKLRVDRARVHVVHGNDEYLVSRAVSDLVRAARDRDRDLEVSDRDASDLTPGAIMEMVSPSLFGGNRVLVVRQARGAQESAASAILSVAADLPDGVVLVVSDVKADGRTVGQRATPSDGEGSTTASRQGSTAARRLASDLLAAGAGGTECNGPTTARERIGFVRDEVARAGGTITADAAGLLVEVIGADTRELASAAGQLVADLSEPGRRRTLQGPDVERFHRGRAEVSAFVLADLVLAGDTVGALEMVRRAAVLGVHPLIIADALASGVRSLARVAAASGGRPLGPVDPDRIGREVKIPGWKVRRLSAVAQDWTPQGLVAAARVTAKLNTALKGAGTIADPQYTLEAAVRAIGSCRHRARGRGRSEG